MVKGNTRQVIVVKSPDTRLFEQAIFLLKEDALEKHGVTERALLEEARRVADSYVARNAAKKKKLHLPPLAWTSVGAAVTGLAWFLSVL